MGLLQRMTECVTGTAFISRSETAAVASNTGAANEIDRLVCPQFAEFKKSFRLERIERLILPWCRMHFRRCDCLHSFPL